MKHILERGQETHLLKKRDLSDYNSDYSRQSLGIMTYLSSYEYFHELCPSGEIPSVPC